MKKKLMALIFAVLCFSAVASLQAEEAKGVGEGKAWSPIRLTLWPRVLGLPWNTNVYGLNLGLATDVDKDCELVGVDLSALGSTTNNATGLLMSIGQTTYNSKCVQICAGAVMQRSSGVQLGLIVSLAGDCGTVVQPFAMCNEVQGADYAVQIGMYNRSIDSKGFQIGFMNYMDDGFLPLFPFFNFSLSETHKDIQDPGKL